MTKQEEMKKCCTAEADKEWYKKEYQSLFEENANYKLIDSCYILCIHLENKNRNIKRKYVYSHRFEIDLEILEKLSNEMQKDLKELELCQD